MNKKRTPELNASLEGVVFADEVTPQSEANPIEEAPLPTPEELKANQKAIKAHLKAQETLGINRPQEFAKTIHPALPPPMSAAEQAALRPKAYKVLETIEVAKGGGKFILRAGKIITENGYNIPQLLRFGAKLEPYELPPVG